MIKQQCCWKENLNELNLCAPLLDRLGDYRGFVVIRVMNTKTGVERELGIAYKNDRKDRGLLLNFCPFCGGNIVPKVEGYSKSEKRE